MKLQRYSIYGFCSPQPTDGNSGNWCDGDDVRKLEESHAELLDLAHQVVENYYDGLGDEQSVARAAQKAITKFEGTK